MYPVKIQKKASLLIKKCLKKKIKLSLSEAQYILVQLKKLKKKWNKTKLETLSNNNVQTFKK